MSRPIVRRLGVIAVIIIHPATGIIAANAVVTFCGFDEIARRDRNDQTIDQAFNTVLDFHHRRPLFRALPPKANIRSRYPNVRQGPRADIRAVSRLSRADSS
jgi:hypothetical protein